jgi:hypothetical protein
MKQLLRQLLLSIFLVLFTHNYAFADDTITFDDGTVTVNSFVYANTDTTNFGTMYFLVTESENSTGVSRGSLVDSRDAEFTTQFNDLFLGNASGDQSVYLVIYTDGREVEFKSFTFISTTRTYTNLIVYAYRDGVLLGNQMLTPNGSNYAVDGETPETVTLNDSIFQNADEIRIIGSNDVGTNIGGSVGIDNLVIGDAQVASDTTPPTLSSITHENIAQTTADLKATSNEASTMYYVVSTSSSTPTAEQVINNTVTGSVKNGSSAVTANTAKTFNVTGLTAGTTYYYYMVATDASGNKSGVESGSFATNNYAGITLSKSTASVNESGTTDSFTVVLDAQPSSDVVLSVISDDTGEATLSPSTLTFTNSNWNTAQTVTITGVDDNSIDGTQNVTVTISVIDGSSDDEYDSLPSETVAVTTVDNDASGFTVSKETASVNESGTTDSFTVVLDAQPSSDVVLSVISDDTGEATLSPSTLTFTNSNWNTAQTVTITGVDDNSIDGTQNVTVTISVIDGSSDDEYDSLPSETVAVTVVDDDSYSISIAKTTDGAENGSGSPTDAVYTITVTPSNTTGSAITGNIAYTGTASEGTDYATGATTFSIADGQSTATITLDVTEDTTVEGTETAIATISSPSTGSLGTASATANITDDDQNSPVIETTFNNVTIDEDNGTSNYEVNVSDIDLDNLTLSVESNDTSLITIGERWSNPITSGEYEGLEFNLTTVANANGIAKITLNLSDGEANVTKTFDVNVTAVNDAPKINTEYEDVNVKQNHGSTSYDVNVSDVDSSDLNITVVSSNTNIVRVTPIWNGLLNSSNWNQEFNLTTVANAHGLVEIKVMVSDGEYNSTKSFNVNVAAPQTTVTNPISGVEEAKSDNALAHIGFHADLSTTSNLSEEEFRDILPALGNIDSANIGAYNAYIDANPDKFSSPATASEVQAMINLVNEQERNKESNGGEQNGGSSTVLVQIGIQSDNNESNFTVEHLKEVEPALSDINSSNIEAYNAYMNANPDDFSSPATADEVQAMIDLVNEQELAKLEEEISVPEEVISESDEENFIPENNESILEADENEEEEVNRPEDDETIVTFDETTEVEQREENGVKIEAVQINEREIEVRISTNGEVNGSVTFEDSDGNSLNSAFEIENNQSQTTVDEQGNIETIVEVGNGSSVKININQDSRVEHEVTTENGTSKVVSRIPGADIKVDAQGTVSITSEVEKDGFIYKTVVTTNSKGESSTKFVKIDVATNEETDLSNTLKEGESFGLGNEVSVLELEGVIYIEVTTPLTESLIIE